MQKYGPNPRRFVDFFPNLETIHIRQVPVWWRHAEYTAVRALVTAGIGLNRSGRPISVFVM